MKLPNYFKILWWIALLIVSSIYLVGRKTTLLAGEANAFDTIALIFWIALLLSPIFYEISFLGVSLRQKIDDVKNEMKAEILNVRSELSAVVSVAPTMNQQVVLPELASHERLEELYSKLQEAVETLKGRPSKGRRRVSGVDSTVETDSIPVELFKIRLSLETAIRNLGMAFTLGDYIETTPAIRIARDLASAHIVPREISDAFLQVYSICSKAVHGSELTEDQAEFVRKTAPKIIDALREL